MKIYFLRHGETNYNVEKRIMGTLDIPLNQKGVSQALLFKNELIKNSISFDKVYTSNLKRAINTAELLNLNLTINKLDEFNERNYGIYQGIKVSEFKEKFPELNDLSNEDKLYLRYEKGESIFNLKSRALNGIDKIVSESSLNDNILVVSHGGTITALLSHYSKTNYFDFKKKVHLKNCSLSLIEKCEDDFQIIYINEILYPDKYLNLTKSAIHL